MEERIKEKISRMRKNSFVNYRIANLSSLSRVIHFEKASTSVKNYKLQFSRSHDKLCASSKYNLVYLVYI